MTIPMRTSAAGPAQHERPRALHRATRRTLWALAIFPLAGVGACDDWFDSLEPADVPPDQVLALGSIGDDRELVRDGRDSVVLVARIPRGARTRMVTFTTTVGTFAVAGGRELVVRAEEDTTLTGPMLVARAALRADTGSATTLGYVTATVEDYRRVLTVVLTGRAQP